MNRIDKHPKVREAEDRARREGIALDQVQTKWRTLQAERAAAQEAADEAAALAHVGDASKDDVKAAQAALDALDAQIGAVEKEVKTRIRAHELLEGKAATVRSKVGTVVEKELAEVHRRAVERFAVVIAEADAVLNEVRLAEEEYTRHFQGRPSPPWTPGFTLSIGETRPATWLEALKAYGIFPAKAA